MGMARVSPSMALGAALAVGMAGTAWADGVLCTAQTQCRGDAERMCAPSSLEISLKRHDSIGTQLWIDHQGPYAARASKAQGTRRYEVKAFGGQYKLDITPDGQFLYVGNRGKRFTGTCKEMS